MGESYTTANGTELFVRDTGEPDLPVVLALHSLFLDGRMFDDFADAAAGVFRVIRPDFRGQGRSAAVAEDIVDMDTNARDIIELADLLGLRRVRLLVQSMGGDVGFRVAAARPDLVGSMVVLGSSACAEPPEQLERFRRWVDDVGTHGFVGSILDDTVAIMLGETTRHDPAKQHVVEKWRTRIAEVPRSLRPAMSGVIERSSVVDLLPKIDVPTLVISGAEDLPRPPSWSDEVVAELPRAELWRLDKIGHSPILEAPEVVLPRILEFFSANGDDVRAEQVESHGVPWEESYGYVQAVKRGDTIYLSGQVAHEGTELVAPAPVDEAGAVTDFANMGAQMRQCYANAATLLERFGASLDDVVDEVLYVVDADAGDAAAGPVRKEAYGRPDPQVASTMIGTPRLAFPELLVEIKFVARV